MQGKWWIISGNQLTKWQMNLNFLYNICDEKCCILGEKTAF